MTDHTASPISVSDADNSLHHHKRAFYAWRAPQQMRNWRFLCRPATRNAQSAVSWVNKKSELMLMRRATASV